MYSNPNVVIEATAVIDWETTVKYRVYPDDGNAEFSFGESRYTTGLSMNLTRDGLRRCAEQFAAARDELDRQSPRPGVR